MWVMLCGWFTTIAIFVSVLVTITCSWKSVCDFLCFASGVCKSFFLVIVDFGHKTGGSNFKPVLPRTLINTRTKHHGRIACRCCAPAHELSLRIFFALFITARYTHE